MLEKLNISLIRNIEYHLPVVLEWFAEMDFLPPGSREDAIVRFVCFSFKPYANKTSEIIREDRHSDAVFILPGCCTKERWSYLTLLRNLA